MLILAQRVILPVKELCQLYRKGILNKIMFQGSLTVEESKRIRQMCLSKPRYFKKVKLSVTAASKMLNHASAGQPYEVLGLLQGSYNEQMGDGVFHIVDVILLPAVASETRVKASNDVEIMMAEYLECLNKVNAPSFVGWYHSHPSYGCWLSGIDVDTQMRFQNNTDPFLAIVIDPIKSVNLQKLDIGAFRTFPDNYVDANQGSVRDVPRRKADDFTEHSKKYYQLPIELVTSEIGKATLKNVEKMEWVNELSYSSFLSSINYLTAQVNDEKQDIQEYLQVKESNMSTPAQIKETLNSTLKKVAYYSKERNLSLIDSGIKSLLF